MRPHAHPGSACLEMLIDPQVLPLFSYFSDLFTSFITHSLPERNELSRTINSGRMEICFGSKVM